jgi:hypothetical protein
VRREAGAEEAREEKGESVRPGRTRLFKEKFGAQDTFYRTIRGVIIGYF